LYTEISSLLTPVFNEISKNLENRAPSETKEQLDFIINTLENEDIKTIDDLRTKIEEYSESSRHPIDMVSLIKDLGKISFSGRISRGDNSLTVNKINKWSDIFKSEKEAIELLKSLGEHSILNEYINRYTQQSWKDSFVADGCIAIYFSYEISSDALNNETIVETIRLLDDKNSLYVLRLALDEHVLLKLIKIVLSTKIELVDIIYESILNDYTLDRIKREEQLEVLFNEIIENIDDKNSNEVLIKISRLLIKLCKLDVQLFEKIGMLSIGRGNKQKAAIAVRAYEFLNNEGYFIYCDSGNIDKLLSTEIAVRIWDDQGTPTIIKRLEEISQAYKKEKAIDLWYIFVDRLDNNKFEFKSNIEFIIQRVLDTKINDYLFRSMLEIVFRRIENVPERARLEFTNWIISHIPVTIIELINNNLKVVGSELLKWLIRFKYPMMHERNSAWIISKNSNIAISKTQYAPRRIPEIIALINEHDYFDLASKKEIISLRQKTKYDLSFENGTLELIKDGFPGEERLAARLPTEAKLLDSGINKPIPTTSLSFVDAEEFNTKMVPWRPIVKLGEILNR
ncbi:MAG: hypothetical protein AAGF85_18460, partial [Bacteroidota bacterium]